MWEGVARSSRLDPRHPVGIPNFLCQEQVSLGEGYLKTPFQVKQGYVAVPRTPGLGIEPDEDALQDKFGQTWQNRETYDLDDGSIVDW